LNSTSSIGTVATGSPSRPNSGDASAIDRHTHATGLFDRRILNLNFAAANIVDHAESITPTSAAVLKAIQACSQIDERGHRIETPRRIITWSSTITCRRPPIGQPQTRPPPLLKPTSQPKILIATGSD
jgi:hypothetical protein